MKRILITAILLAIATTGFSQATRSQLRKGNRDYGKEKYDQAEVDYRRALEADSSDFRGQYNLGNTLYRQKKYDEAARHYQQALGEYDIDDHQRARTWHNLGNSLFQTGRQKGEQGMNDLQQAANAYREALKLEPKDEDTRYNFALTQKLLQQMQQQSQQQQQGGGQQNQQQQDQQQQQQQSQQQEQQQEQNQQQQQGGEEQQAHQAKANDKDMQDAERMLEAVKNNERQTLKEQTQKEQKSRPARSGKDW